MIVLIGKGTIGTSLSRNPNTILLSHEHVGRIPRHSTIIVNCAAIAGKVKCEQADEASLMIANVELPLQLAQLSREIGCVFVQPSTAGVYKQQFSNNMHESVSEEDAVHGYNDYTRSKIVMEQELTEKYPESFIFRIPMFFEKSVLEQKMGNWTHVVNTLCSIIYPETLWSEILKAQEIYRTTRTGGIFNIITANVWFPQFVKRINPNVEISDEYPPDSTSNPVLDCRKWCRAKFDVEVRGG